MNIIDGGEYISEKILSFQGDRNTYFEVDFTDCLFENSSFFESTFKDCRFENCRFRSCDLSGIKVTDSVFIDVSFDSCRLTGVDWTTKVSTVFSKLAFKECNISYSSFAGLKLMETVFISCKANDVDFSDANLSKAIFDYTDLAMARFVNTNLMGADFSCAFNYAIDPQANRIRRAVFGMPEAMSLLDSFGIVIR